MSALVVTIARFALLFLLWLFIFFVLVTVRNDVYGGKLLSRKQQKFRLRKQKSLAARNSAQPAADPAFNTAAATPFPAPPTEPQLYVIQGALAGTTIRIGRTPVSVGRSPDSVLVLDDGYASARHARFYLQNGQVILEDLNSTNGTWVNNQQVHQPVALPLGARITIGKTVLELR